MHSPGFMAAKQILPSLGLTNLHGRRLVLRWEPAPSLRSSTGGCRQKNHEGRPLDWQRSRSSWGLFCMVFSVRRFPTFPVSEHWQLVAAVCSSQECVCLDGRPFNSETISALG